MLVVSPDALRELGHDASSARLPPLGASPDAIIQHRVPITREDLLEGCRLVRRLTGQHGEGGRDGRELSCRLLESIVDLPGGGVLGPEEALSRVSEALVRRALSRVEVSMSNIASIRPASVDSDPLTDEATSPLSLANNTWRASVTAISEKLNATESRQSDLIVEALTALDDVLWVDIREAVEVKNHAPFVFKDERKARKGRLHLEYRIADQGPMLSVRPAWVPQLQMHCLAAGVPSVLLLSRSATKGVRLFRMER